MVRTCPAAGLHPHTVGMPYRSPTGAWPVDVGEVVTLSESAVYDAQMCFVGHNPRQCGEHRTVGDHRAWCHDCSEWCYPTQPCRSCLLAKEFICDECGAYLGSLSGYGPDAAVTLSFTCQDCSAVNEWSSTDGIEP